MRRCKSVLGDLRELEVRVQIERLSRCLSCGRIRRGSKLELEENDAKEMEWGKGTTTAIILEKMDNAALVWARRSQVLGRGWGWDEVFVREMRLRGEWSR